MIKGLVTHFSVTDTVFQFCILKDLIIFPDVSYTFSTHEYGVLRSEFVLTPLLKYAGHHHRFIIGFSGISIEKDIVLLSVADTGVYPVLIPVHATGEEALAFCAEV